jgi:hypothetical protein
MRSYNGEPLYGFRSNVFSRTVFFWVAVSFAVRYSHGRNVIVAEHGGETRATTAFSKRSHS